MRSIRSNSVQVLTWRGFPDCSIRSKVVRTGPEIIRNGARPSHARTRARVNSRARVRKNERARGRDFDNSTFTSAEKENENAVY